MDKFKNNEVWSKEVTCDRQINRGWLISPIVFDFYIHNLEACLEEQGFVGTTLLDDHHPSS